MCIYMYTYISVLVICLFTAICLCKDYNRVSKSCKQFSLIFVLCDHLGESSPQKDCCW